MLLERLIPNPGMSFIISMSSLMLIVSQTCSIIGQMMSCMLQVKATAMLTDEAQERLWSGLHRDHLL